MGFKSFFFAVLLSIFAALANKPVSAQPGYIGTELVDGVTYSTYTLNDFGIFRQARLQATVDIASFGPKWEFPDATLSYDPVWRPYNGTCNGGPDVSIPAFNSTIAPDLVYFNTYASGVYNTGFGGCGGYLPAVTSGRYYTFNITEYSLPGIPQNEYMGVLETNYEPVDIITLSQSPSTGVTSANNVLISVTIDNPLSTGEYLYLRYANTYNFNASIVLPMIMGASSTTYFEYIPCTTDSVYYYVFSSNRDLTTLTSEASSYGEVAYDMLTLDLINNGGPNYSYLPILSPDPCYYVLPLELLQFDVSMFGGEAQLFWTTSAEMDVSHFDIERSKDGIHWSKIGMLYATGQEEQLSEYVFTDRNPYTGLSYYRLKMLDTDGSIDWSPTRSIEWQSSSTVLFQMAPNPAGNLTNLVAQTSISGVLQTSIFDLNGKLLQTDRFQCESGMHALSLDLSRFQSGLYVLEISLNGLLLDQQKLMIQR